MSEPSDKPFTAAAPSLDAIIDALPAAVFVYRYNYAAADDLLYISKGMEAIYGTDRKAFLNDPSLRYAVVHPDYRTAFYELREAAGRKRQPWQYEWVILTPAGDTKWLQGRAVPYEDAAGDVLYVGVTIETGKEQRFEDELQSFEERFRALAENVPGALFRYILRPDGSLGIDFISRGCETLFEVTGEEISRNPQKLWDIVVPEDLPAMQQSVQESSETLATWIHQWRIVTRSGAMKFVEGRGKPFRTDDGTVVWNTLVLDRTEQFQAQQALRQREQELAKLQERFARASRTSELGELASAIAHEVNQPLAAIMNYSFALQTHCRNALGIDDAKLEDLVSRLTDQADRASAIVQRVRGLLKRGIVELAPEPVPAVIREAIDLWRLQPSPGIELTTRLADDLPLIPIDRIQLQQVLVNLIRNAADALQGSPQPRIAVECLKDDDRLLITIADNGPGIPDEVKHDIFDAFTTTKQDGTGVGLSISKSIIEAHSGRIWAEDNSAGGATFCISLPIQSHGPNGFDRR